MAAEHFPTFREINRRIRAMRQPAWLFNSADKAWFPTFAPWFLSLIGRGGVTVTQRRSLLRLIQVAAKERLSLSPLVSAWAHEEPLPQRKRLRKLSQVLADGLPIADAVERFSSLLSDEEILLVRFASESGTLAASLGKYLEVATDAAAPVRENLRRSKNYLLMMMLIGVPIALWVFVFVNPLLQQIDDDFAIDQTPFRRMHDIQRILFDWMVPLGFVVIAILVAGRWLKGPWRSFRRRVAPIVFGSVRSLRISHLLRRLSETSIVGKPLAGAVSTLARNHYDPTLRHKLLYARNELTLGAELWPSFHTAGLLSNQELRALDLGDRLDVTGWTLAALADARERRAIRLQTRLSMGLWLAVVLLFGVFVLIHAIGMISFLSDLITYTA